MIPGIVAAQNAATGWSGAKGLLDFVNGIFSWEGTSYDASHFIDHTEYIAGGMLSIPGATNFGSVQVLNEFATALASCQWTLVIEVDLTATNISSFETYFLTMADGYGNNIQCRVGDGAYDLYDTYVRDPWDETGYSTGIHKAAFTRTDAFVSLSIDGNSITGHDESVNLPLPVNGQPMNSIYLGGTSSVTGRALQIRSLAIYDPVDDADLPTLSA